MKSNGTYRPADYEYETSVFGKMGFRDHHRKIAEARVGHKLKTSEVVHHKNGDKRDNRNENLEIESRADHSRRHMPLEFVGRIRISQAKARQAALAGKD